MHPSLKPVLIKHFQKECPNSQKISSPELVSLTILKVRGGSSLVIMNVKHVGWKSKGETSASPGQHKQGDLYGRMRERENGGAWDNGIKERTKRGARRREWVKGAVRWADVKDCMVLGGQVWRLRQELWMAGKTGRREPGGLAGHGPGKGEKKWGREGARYDRYMTDTLGK